ncbi:ABC transporter ATP-binding protein [Pseudogemmatithrix spongiicola]|uniref:ABC transporter ATP-binding protein n=1 Tax=Pseudogemmatithrix spongiicola TaxID=3062599 RepID=A0AA49K248_9BACT|nr:ABC transporter ATP-binding protein [Gemmatimonadaceae bacterium 'strain 138']WKW16007.1 ABC transporter ATP-binding protein [Gemmatimonadaceae bacterium 'strain 318']
MIVLDNVSKTYRTWRGPGVRAVSNVTLEIARGEVVGIAGPNGAGKSTLIAMLLGMLSPDEGRLTIDGVAPRAYVERNGVAYLPELMTWPLTWRTDEALRRMAILAGIPADRRRAEVDRVIDAVGIGEHRRKRLKALSKGNLQRVGLAHALLTDRAMVIFDEPTHGLDPVWTARFRDIVAGIRRADRAVLIASHNLDELERLCDRVAIVDRGAIQRVVEVRGGAGITAPRRWRIRVTQAPDAVAAAFPGAVINGPDIECTADVAGLNAGLAAAITAGALVTAVGPSESSLEEAFRSAVTAR